MLRSMFTAISALNLHQSYLDVVSNNLANANTTGYKSNRVLFQDQFYQMMSPGSGPTDTLGGTNPTQVGLGLQLGYISPVFTQGMLQSTGRNLDLAIQGNGFFVYDQGANRRYSREGSLNLDSSGFLVNTASGLRAQGWTVDANGNVDPNLPPDNIQIITDRTVAKATESADFGGNLSTATATAGTVTTTMGIYDSLGKLHTATIEFTRGDTTTNPTDWTWRIVPDPAAPAGYAGAGTISFTSDGQYDTSTVTTAISIPGSAGAEPITLDLDLTKLTMLTGDNSAAITTQDGLPTGSFSDIYITPNDGKIFLVYSNGMREQVAQLAVANFTNPTGLIRAGHTAFQQGLNSGEAQIGVAGTTGRGAIAAGYLEASNVDMAQEFTNMILAQRGFQASSRVITTSDEILQELVNLKR